MATRLNMVVLVVMALAGLLQSSTAQTTHVVGNSLGWTIPPGGPIAYSTWADQETFTVGDILVFNFTEGEHNVAKVTKAAFDSCNGTAPISLITTSPANITLDVAGEHYFICTFTGHCDVGQKLAINVSAATSPAPQSPEAAPTPVPSRAPMTYNVGDAMGWIVPPGGPIAYETWAYNKTFMVQDTLVFNFTEGVHDVAEVTKEVYLSCNITATISNTSTSPARIVLSTAGEHYFTSTFPRQCILGQKLAINVTTTSTASPPSPTAPAPSSTATPPSSIATPPSSTATPPSSPASSPSTSVTPPSTSTSPPSSITPITPGPTGSGATPLVPTSSAPSFVAAGFPTAFLTIVVALLF